MLILEGKILLIRPKLVLAESGNHREGRWFVPWKSKSLDMHFPLPHFLSFATKDKQIYAPFGDALLRFQDLTIGIEVCEEVFAMKKYNTVYSKIYL